jgi:hypothetical protein
MHTRTLSATLLSLLALACQSTAPDTSGDAPRVVDVDPAQREALFAAVRSLEGKWQSEGPDGEPSYSTFEVTSAGSAVREVMLPGTEHEMTNMYTLDGNELVMVHYCAGGNQPIMRADSFEDGRLVFRSAGVRDLKAADEVYMGSMTLVVIDADKVEQQWVALKGGEVEHEMTIALERVK